MNNIEKMSLLLSLKKAIAPMKFDKLANTHLSNLRISVDWNIEQLKVKKA